SGLPSAILGAWKSVARIGSLSPTTHAQELGAPRTAGVAAFSARHTGYRGTGVSVGAGALPRRETKPRPAQVSASLPQSGAGIRARGREPSQECAGADGAVHGRGNAPGTEPDFPVARGPACGKR